MIEDFFSAVPIAGYLVLFLVVAWLTLRRIVNILVARAVKRRRMAKSAPEDGSGLLAKDNFQ